MTLSAIGAVQKNGCAYSYVTFRFSYVKLTDIVHDGCFTLRVVEYKLIFRILKFIKMTISILLIIFNYNSRNVKYA